MCILEVEHKDLLMDWIWNMRKRGESSLRPSFWPEKLGGY